MNLYLSINLSYQHHHMHPAANQLLILGKQCVNVKGMHGIYSGTKLILRFLSLFDPCRSYLQSATYEMRTTLQHVHGHTAVVVRSCRCHAPYQLCQLASCSVQCLLLVSQQSNIMLQTTNRQSYPCLAVTTVARARAPAGRTDRSNRQQRRRSNLGGRPCAVSRRAVAVDGTCRRARAATCGVDSPCCEPGIGAEGDRWMERRRRRRSTTQAPSHTTSQLAKLVLFFGTPLAKN